MNIRGEIFAGGRGLLRRKQWFGRIVSSYNGQELMRTSEGYNNQGECAATLQAVSPGIEINVVPADWRKKR